jgi:uncharacterized protein
MDKNAEAAYVRALTEMRQQKDDFFREDPDSPIPPIERTIFPGLRYFTPNPDLRVEARVERLKPGEPVVMATSDGSERPFERYALLHFMVDDQHVRLTAYRTPGEIHEPLFIPFRDALAGKETYGAGRYLEVEPPHEHEGGTEHVVLDFNLAYNPFCAYNEHYSCPIPPRENTLPVAVRAGERVYHDE